MKWIDDYATGVERIDEQHKLIFKTTDDYRIALDADKGEKSYELMLNFLLPYCRGHFGFEENCMEKYHCPVAAQNKEAHARFKEVLEEFQRRYKASGFQETEARALLDTVEQWLAGHIGRIDVHLRECAQDNT
jgi:hemerythrin